MASIQKPSTENADADLKNAPFNDVESSSTFAAEAGNSVILDPEAERSYGKLHRKPPHRPLRLA